MPIKTLSAWFAAANTLFITLVTGFAPPLAANPIILPSAKAPVELRLDTSGGFDARSWRLDSAVFTEITPFIAPDIAIKLPEYAPEKPPESSSKQVEPRSKPRPSNSK